MAALINKMSTFTRIIIGIIGAIIFIAVGVNMGITDNFTLGAWGAIGIVISSYITGMYRKDNKD